MPIGIEDRLCMIKGIAGLLTTVNNPSEKDIWGAAEAICEMVTQIEEHPSMRILLEAEVKMIRDSSKTE